MRVYGPRLWSRGSKPLAIDRCPVGAIRFPDASACAERHQVRSDGGSLEKEHVPEFVPAGSTAGTPQSGTTNVSTRERRNEGERDLGMTRGSASGLDRWGRHRPCGLWGFIGLRLSQNPRRL